MKLLMLSRDPEIFREESEARSRMKEYGAIFDELHIVVAMRRQELGITNHESWISKNVKIYPAVFFSALRIASSIIHNSKFMIQRDWITTQDPFELGLVGWRLEKKFGIPLQLQVHTDFLSPYFSRESLKNRGRVTLAKFLLPKADSIRVVSKRIKDSIVGRANLSQEGRPPKIK